MFYFYKNQTQVDRLKLAMNFSEPFRLADHHSIVQQLGTTFITDPSSCEHLLPSTVVEFLHAAHAHDLQMSQILHLVFG